MNNRSLIPESWLSTTLDEYCTFTQGIQIPHSEQINEIKDGYIRYLYIRDYFSDSSPCYIPNEYPHKIMNEDDIMMVNTGNTSGTVYSGKHGVLSNNAFKIEFDKAFVDRDFIFQFLRSNFLMKNLKSLYNHGGQPHVGHKNVAKVPIDLPPLPEQQKIAEILSTVDDKIDIIDQQITETTQLKKGLMQRLLTKGIGHNEFKDSLLGEIPKSWEVVKLGEVLTIGSGKDYKHLKKGNIPVYGTGGLMTMVDEYLYDGESVGIGRKGTIDKPVFLNGKFWTVDTLFYTHSFKNITPYYTYLIFQTIPWRKYNEATGVPSLSRVNIENLNAIIPPLPEQQKISTILLTVDDKLEVLQDKKSEYKELKKGLMQQLLTGKKRVFVENIVNL